MPLVDTVKQINDFIDRGFEATGLPQVFGWTGEQIGSGVDYLAGTHVAPTIRNVAEQLPRTLVESALTVPEAASVVGAPAAAATWANRLNKLRQAVGYGSAATRGYAETESPWGALIGAGQMYGANKLLLPSAYGGLGLAERAAGPVRRWLSPLEDSGGRGLLPAGFAEGVGSAAAGLAAEAGAMTGLNELTRQGMMSVGPNAVPWGAEERNPLTQENIAANVAGTAMFAPQAVRAFRNRPRIAKASIDRWIEEKGVPMNAPETAPAEMPAVESPGGTAPMRGTLPYVSPTPESRQAARLPIVRNALREARIFDADGNYARAMNARSNALDAIDAMAEAGPVSPEQFDAIRTAVDQAAREMPPTTPEGFQGFVDQVKGIVAQLNEGRVSYEQEVASREAALRPGDTKGRAEFETWKRSQQAAIGKTWHPEARDPLVIERLWKSGNLQPLTPEWLAAEFNATFDQSGNAQFAQRVVAQKVANYALAHLPEALTAEARTRKATTESSKGVRQLSALDEQFVKALQELPPELQDAVIQRTVDVQRYGNFTPQEAERMGISQGVWHHPLRPSETVNAYIPWQRAVVLAVKRMDPTSGTTLLPFRGKGMQRTTLDTLVRRDASGRYVWDAGSSTVPLGAGGKPTKTVEGKKVFEQNIEGLPTQRAQEGVGATEDEALFQQALAEEGMPGDISAMNIEEGGATSPVAEPKVDLAAPTTPEATASLAEMRTKVDAVLNSLTDAQVWQIARDRFVPGTTERTDLKLALRAKLDPAGPAGQEFYQKQIAAGKVPKAPGNQLESTKSFLRTYFQEKSPIPGAKSDFSASDERAVQIVRKLVQPGVVERAKTGLRPQAKGDDIQRQFDRHRSADIEQAEDFLHNTGYDAIYDDNGKFVSVHKIGDAPEMNIPLTSSLVKEFHQNTKYAIDRLQRELAGADTNFVVNPPPPGQFVPDVERTFRNVVSKTLGRAGYSGTAQEFVTDVAVALAKQMPELEFYRLSSEVQGLAEPVAGKGRLGLNVDKLATGPGALGREMVRLLETLGHELSHMDQFIRDGLIPKPDAYSDERKRIVDDMHNLADNLAPEERRAMLTMIDESIPEHLRSLTRDQQGQPYGTNDPNEFVAEMQAKTLLLLMNDTKAGRAFAQETLDYAPTEVREFARSTFRTVADTMRAMKEAVESGAYGPNADKVILRTGFDSLLDAATVMSELRHSERVLAQVQEAMGIQTPGGMARPADLPNAVWFYNNKAMEGYYHPSEKPAASETAIDAINAAQEHLGGRPTGRGDAYTDWLYPFTNKMHELARRGNEIAYDVLTLAQSVEGSRSKLLSGLLGDFIKHSPDGRMSINTANPIVNGIMTDKNGRWRGQGNNPVSQWQRDHYSQSMFVKDENGQIIVNPDPELKAQEAWDRISARLSREDQQLLMGLSVAEDGMMRRSQDIIEHHVRQSHERAIAAVLASYDKRLTYDKAWAIGRQIYTAYLNGNPAVVQSLMSPPAAAAVGRVLGGKQMAVENVVRQLNPQLDPVAVQGKARQWLIALKEGSPEQFAAKFGQPVFDALRPALKIHGLLDVYSEIVDKFSNRPGFRTESQPHEWLVKYRVGDKTYYTSAPEEVQAKAIADRLRREGKTVIGNPASKKQLRDVTEFDNPDELLTKVQENETYVWDQFVNEMEKTHGTAFADELRAGYSPGAESMKDFGRQGLKGFLSEGERQVEYNEFDSLDAQLAYVRRLSNAITARDTQQQLRLMKTDPRMRTDPVFTKMVDQHFQSMFEPTSKRWQQARSLSSSFYLLGALTSPVVNGTQSFVTLAPHLIAGVDPRVTPKGGVVNAYNTMFKAVGDVAHIEFGKDWHKDISTADPKTWTLDQALATLYHKRTLGSGFQQTIIDDIMHGGNIQSLLLAKFGRGDYGPVSKTDMAMDGLHSLSQFGMIPYKLSERLNTKIAFLSGVRQGFEHGLRGDDLYNYAVRMQSLGTGSGGRANAPGIIAKTAGADPAIRGAVGVANALQQYGYLLVGTFATLAKDSFSKSRNLSPAQRVQAQKALGTMLITQTALAGALGIPFVGAALTVLENVFGIPANAAVRQGLAKLAGGDDDKTGFGATFAEIALNGFPNQVTGLDLSSRLGTSSLFGTSSYRGFNLVDMLGPAPSIGENMVKALGYFGGGEPLRAASMVVPNAFKNLLQMSDTKAKYGDFGFRDAAGNLLYTPTAGEAVGYGFGIRPRILSQKRQMQRMTQVADDISTQARDRELDRAAMALMRGDPTPSRLLALNRQSADRTVNPYDTLRSIMDRAIGQQSEKDLLATGPTYNEQERWNISKTFGPEVNPRQSEMSIQRMRMQLAQLLQAPQLAPTQESYEQAMMVDRLVQQQGMPRSQAVRLVTFLSRQSPPGMP